MGRISRAFPLILLILAFTSVTRAIPNHSDPGLAMGQSPELKVITGELAKVDLENQTLTLKLENDEEAVFQYDADTRVEGRENGVQGLSTETGTKVTVSYTEEEGKRTATKIEIKKSDG